MISAAVGRSSRSILKNSLRQRASLGSVSRNHLSRNNFAANASSTRNSTSLAPIIGTQSNGGNDFSLNWMKTAAAMAAAGAFVASGNVNNKTDCCGIVGVVGTKEYDAR